ncbi:phenylacetic acid degradation protein PaaN [Tropicimonas sp. IMCC34011]|uniref:phenylacetic acid degradation protein PaaN n=1 Tax=Tropicimonas sp. IMCC34011 TaxID=2248759 RepID=UPI000E253E37|nr:phenylacetic acid degradation protein PaaN [Tropicimonas sp. IMCC34011]
MADFMSRHGDLLSRAVEASKARAFWTPFPEIPSGKIYGESARTDGAEAFAALKDTPFEIAGHPEERRVGGEVSPWGGALGITYPAACPDTLIEASESAFDVWSEAPVETRIGVCLEALTRLNAMSFLLGHATEHTTGQAFPMAFQAGGPHAQDRGLEAVAAAYDELTRHAAEALWEKPQGKRPPIVIRKQWHIVPRGVALTIGCNTFPNWNGYPGLFASLATGNTVIVKPHPGAILPLALTVRVLRDVLAEADLPRDAVLLAADERGAEITEDLVTHSATRIVDYTGSGTFASWIRRYAGQALFFSEETGVNSVTILGTDDFRGMCANLAFSLSLYSGQMCTSPQNVYVPRGGIETDEGPKTFDEVGAGLAQAIDALLEDRDAAAQICGAIVRPEVAERAAEAASAGRVIRSGGETGHGRSATPWLVAVDGPEGPQEDECFGPVAFLIPCDDGEAAISAASGIAASKGAITAALYSRDEGEIDRASRAFARAGVNLSVNLTGGIYVNQSAAFSDFHITGGNPAGNASLTDTAFVAPRFRRAMVRWPEAPKHA